MRCISESAFRLCPDHRDVGNAVLQELLAVLPKAVIFVEVTGIRLRLDAAGLRGKVKVMIGGAPVTQSFCDQIGADAYTADAATAAEVALRFCTEA